MLVQIEELKRQEFKNGGAIYKVRLGDNGQAWKIVHMHAFMGKGGSGKRGNPEKLPSTEEHVQTITDWLLRSHLSDIASQCTGLLDRRLSFPNLSSCMWLMLQNVEFSDVPYSICWRFSPS